MIHDPDLDASAGTLYWLAHDDHLGETVGRRATPDEVGFWLRESAGVDYEAGLLSVVSAAKDMRANHISLLPRADYAVTDKDGIQRLDLPWVVRKAVEAALGGGL